MAWVDLNTVQYMTTMHTIDEMKEITLERFERCHEIVKSAKNRKQILFSISIVEYNTDMSGSDGNAQQRSYYSSHRSDCRRWWPIFGFFLEAAGWNVYKLWDLLYPHWKMTHLEFQHQIVAELLTLFGQTRQRIFALSMIFTKIKNSSDSCEWKHMSKLLYRMLCDVQLS